MPPSVEPDNKSVRAALQRAEAQAERRRKILRAALLLLGLAVLTACVVVLGAVR